MFPLFGWVQPVVEPELAEPAVGEEIVLRVPGMTESFTMVRCPAGPLVFDGNESGNTIPELYVLTTEVTWDLYDIYLYKLDEPEPGSVLDGVSRPSKPYVPPDRGFGHEGYPAIGMTRKAAEGFCDWLGLKTGLEIRLPTVAEWQHLARAGDEEPGEPDSIAWHRGNAEHTTHPVGGLRPNAFGLFDVFGNAAEWVVSDTRKPIAYGGGYRDLPEESTAESFQKQMSNWNQSDPQIPKSQWWLADCSWVGFRFVIEAEGVDPEQLEELMHETEQAD